MNCVKKMLINMMISLNVKIQLAEILMQSYKLQNKKEIMIIKFSEKVNLIKENKDKIELYLLLINFDIIFIEYI